jgi:heme uptake protein IsdC
VKKAISGIIAAFCIWMLVGAGSAQAAGLADGTYTGDYLILQADNDSVSMANDYWEKPANIVIKDGKATVRVTINHSFWVTQFKVPGGGGYVDTKVVSSNKKADTRLVEFTADITKPIVSKIHVTVADIDYDHDYTIRFVFDTDSFKLVKKADTAQSSEPSPKPTEKPAVTPAPTPTPAATEKPEQTSKPAAAASSDSQPAASETTNPVVQAEDKAAGSTDTDAGKDHQEAEASTAPASSPSASAETTVQEQPEVAAESTDAGAEQSANDASSVKASDEAGGTELAVTAQGEEHALSAGEINTDADGSGNWVWWLITAVIIVGAGGIVIWRRKAR